MRREEENIDPAFWTDDEYEYIRLDVERNFSKQIERIGGNERTIVR